MVILKNKKRMVNMHTDLLSKIWSIFIKSILWIIFAFKDACDENSGNDSTLESAIVVAIGVSCLLVSVAILFQPISRWHSLIAFGAYLIVGILSHLSATAWRGNSGS
jgi:Flp pilus assembly protein TadB